MAAVNPELNPSRSPPDCSAATFNAAEQILQHAVETLDTVVAVCFAERFAPYFRRKIGATGATAFRVTSAQEKCNGQSKTWH